MPVSHQQFEIQHRLSSQTVLCAGSARSRPVHVVGQFGYFNMRVPQLLTDGHLGFPLIAPRVNSNFERIATRQTQFSSLFHALPAFAYHHLARSFRVQFNCSWARSIDEYPVATFPKFESRHCLPLVF
jgi:hypothetical protein